MPETDEVIKDANATPNGYWADANKNGVPDKLEAIGGLFGMFFSGIIKTLEKIGLSRFAETFAEKVVPVIAEKAANRLIDQVSDKWFGE